MPSIKREAGFLPSDQPPPPRVRRKRGTGASEPSSTSKKRMSIDLGALGAVLSETTQDIKNVMAKKLELTPDEKRVRVCKVIQRDGMVPVLAMMTLVKAAPPIQARPESSRNRNRNLQGLQLGPNSQSSKTPSSHHKEANSSTIYSLGMISSEWFHPLSMLHCESECLLSSLHGSLMTVEERLGTPLLEFVGACHPHFEFESDLKAARFMMRLPYTVLTATGKFAPRDIVAWCHPNFDTFIDNVRVILGIEEAFAILSLMPKLPSLAKDPSKAKWESIRPICTPLVERKYIKQQGLTVYSLVNSVSRLI